MTAKETEIIAQLESVRRTSFREGSANSFYTNCTSGIEAARATLTNARQEAEAAYKQLIKLMIAE